MDLSYEEALAAMPRPPEDVPALPERVFLFERDAFEALVRTWTQHPRCLAAIDAYRQGFGTFEEMVRKIYVEPPEISVSFDYVEFTMLIFEITNRMDDGVIAVPDKVRADFVDFYAEFGWWRGPIRNAAQRRSYGQHLKGAALEKQLRVWTRHERFLVAVDSYRKNCGSFPHMLSKAFAAPPYIPVGFDNSEFHGFVFDVADRLASDVLSIPPEALARYADFYEPIGKWFQWDEHEPRDDLPKPTRPTWLYYSAKEVEPRAVEWLENRAFLCAIDAFRAGFGRGQDILLKTIGRRLSIRYALDEFLQIVLLAAKALQSGRVTISAEAQREHAGFYQQTGPWLPYG